MAFTRHGVVFCDAKMSPKTYNQKHTPQKKTTSTGLCFSSKKQHVSPKKKTLPWLFFYTKITEPNPPKPPNRPTTKPQLNPSILSSIPHSPGIAPGIFPTHGTRCSGAGGLKNLVQTKRRPVNSSPAVANGADGRDAMPSTAGDGS